jgi:GNAT superfamily N-acetyltransferase
MILDNPPLSLRPIRPGDAAAMLRLHARLSERTRYLRFFTPCRHLPAAQLRRFVNVDHHDREAYVVVAGARIVAVGRYERIAPGSPEAEVALVVEDACQGRGIGSALLEQLAEAARANGIDCFVGTVLPENRGILRMLNGHAVRRTYDGGLLELGIPLGAGRPSTAILDEASA